jgi:hypothetical protein
MKTKFQILFQGQNVPLFKKLDSKIHKQHLVRSTAMKYKTVVKSLNRGGIALLTIALIATMAVGQNLTIGGGATFVGNGQYNIKGNITSAASTSISGTVNLDGAAQSITGGALTFKNLTIAGTDVKNANVNITVQGQLTVNQNLIMF